MIHLKTLSALILGLAFQFSQMQAGALSETGPVKAASSCCTGDCPCAHGGKSEPQKAPAFPAPQTLKFVAVNMAQDEPADVAPVATQHETITTKEYPVERITGYAGVHFTVAFCSFVI